MAVAQGFVSSPPAGAAATRGRLALAFTDAVMCLRYASLWLLFAVGPAEVFGFFAGDSTVVHVARVIARCAVISFLVCTVAAILLIEKVKAPAGLRSSAPEMKEDLGLFFDFYGNGISIAYLIFVVLVIVGFMVNWFSHKGSLGERIGLAIMGLGFLTMSTLMCLIFIPTIALRSWKMRRSGWRWGSKFECFP
ncbi:hypothetical protein EJB05_49100 [Eragrostis curvula]|uniref:Uncharacterized protein n=1 Tax=Eragrostis curvula TaxID=38414 RepID=A0A5J9T3G6_9POAL|nr:hypothetical protein EJB05_49100 [Eragrostis curvula]